MILICRAFRFTSGPPFKEGGEFAAMERIVGTKILVNVHAALLDRYYCHDRFHD